MWTVELPPHATALLTLQLVRPLLAVDELPADASRGIDLGAAALRYWPVRPGLEPTPRELYTDGALLPVPVSDQSMSYNVISATSTLLALFAGSMFNLLVRSEPPCRRHQSADGTAAALAREGSRNIGT